MFSQGVRENVDSVENLLLGRAYEFFEIRQPRKSSSTIDKYKSLLSCFGDDIFPPEKQLVVRNAIAYYEGVDSIERLRLLLSRLECLRAGPSCLSDFEVIGESQSSEMQLNERDGLPLGPLGRVEVSRNMILDQMLKYEAPRLTCDICSNEEVDIALYSCSCAIFCCVPCTLRLSKQSARPFSDGPKCPHCRAISPRTFIDIKTAKAEAASTLADIIARNSKHKRYKDTNQKDLTELCVNYHCMSGQEHYDGGYAESLATYTVEQLQLELVCLSIQQESLLKDLDRVLGPLRHIRTRTHHFYSVFIKLYKEYKQTKPPKQSSSAVDPGDELFEMLTSSVLKAGSIEEQRRQQIENTKVLSQKFSMMIEDEELDTEDLNFILDGHVAPADFKAFACSGCTFECLSGAALRKHQSLFHSLRRAGGENTAPAKAAKKSRKPDSTVSVDAPIPATESQLAKVSRSNQESNLHSQANSNQSPFDPSIPSATFTLSHASMHRSPPQALLPKTVLSIFDDDEDEAIFVPYSNRINKNVLNANNSSNRPAVLKPDDCDSDDLEILVHERTVGYLREDKTNSDEEEEYGSSMKSADRFREELDSQLVRNFSKSAYLTGSDTRKDDSHVLSGGKDSTEGSEEGEVEEAEFRDESSDGEVHEVPQGSEHQDDAIQSPPNVVSSAAAPDDSGVGDKHKLYKYEYANLDDDAYAPVKLDKSLLLRVTEKIHQKDPSKADPELPSSSHPFRQSDASVIDISNNFTIFNNLHLSGQYEIIFQTFSTHAIKGETAAPEFSGSFLLPFYLEMDRHDSNQCYHHVGINKILRGQS